MKVREPALFEKAKKLNKQIVQHYTDCFLCHEEVCETAMQLLREFFMETTRANLERTDKVTTGKNA